MLYIVVDFVAEILNEYIHEFFVVKDVAAPQHTFIQLVGALVDCEEMLPEPPHVAVVIADDLCLFVCTKEVIYGLKTRPDLLVLDAPMAARILGTA